MVLDELELYRFASKFGTSSLCKVILTKSASPCSVSQAPDARKHLQIM